MPKALFSTLSSWSYSVYQKYIQCPRSVCFDKIQRIRISEPPSPNLDYGSAAHGIAQQFVLTKGGLESVLKIAVKETNKERVAKREHALAPEHFKRAATTLEAHTPLLERLRKAKAKVELQWTFTKAYAATTWFAGDAWLRMIIDALAQTDNVIDIVDYKTGKVYPDHAQQRSLYGLGALQLVQIGHLGEGAKDIIVRPQHVYLDTGQSATEEFRMKDLKPLKREWEQRIKRMMSDTEFPTKTGPHCRWCKFAKSKGGPCPEKV